MISIACNCLFIFLLSACIVSAAFDAPLPSPEIAAAAELRMSILRSPAGMAICPAVMSQDNKISASLSGQRLYSLTGLDSYFAAASYGGRRFCIAISYQTLGESDLYMESALGLMASFSIARYMSVGAGLNFNRIEMGAGYSNADCVSSIFGVESEPWENLIIHAAVSNPSEPEIVSRTRLRREFRMAVSVSQFAPIELAVGLSKRRDCATRFQVAESYQISSDFMITGGMMTSPFVPSAGFGIAIQGFRISYAYRFHADLGSTHVWGITYSR